MTRRRALLVGLLAIVVFVLGWLLPTKPSVQKPAVVGKETRPKGIVVTVRADKNWSEASEQELREFASAFGSQTLPKGFRLEADVASGESIVADVYEAGPGEFVFTQITPRVATSAEGTKCVEVTVNAFRINPKKGRPAVFGNSVMEVPLRGMAIMTALAEEMKHVITMRAKIAQDEASIHFTADGKYEKRPSTDLILRQ